MNERTIPRYLFPLMREISRLDEESSRYAEISVKITKHDGDIVITDANFPEITEVSFPLSV